MKRPPISIEYLLDVARDMTNGKAARLVPKIEEATNDHDLFRLAYTVYILADFPADSVAEVRNYGEHLHNN